MGRSLSDCMMCFVSGILFAFCLCHMTSWLTVALCVYWLVDTILRSQFEHRMRNTLDEIHTEIKSAREMVRRTRNEL